MTAPDPLDTARDAADEAWKAIKAHAQEIARDRAPWTPQLAALALVQQAREQDGVD